MEEFCFICGISGKEVKLFNGVVEEGYELVCEKCAFDEKIPIFRLSKSEQIKREEVAAKRVSEELAKNRGKENIEKKHEDEIKRKEIANYDLTLKEIIDRNYENKIVNTSGKPLVPLIDNFHWIIKRLESYLNILIRRDPVIKKKYNYGERDQLLKKKGRLDHLRFDTIKDDMKDLKVSDLNKIQEEISYKRNLQLLKEAEEEALKEEYDRLEGSNSKKNSDNIENEKENDKNEDEEI